MKKSLKAAIIILGILLLAGCANTSHNKEYSTTIEGGNLKDFLKETDDSELKYYNTIEEAILANNFKDEHVSNIKKIAKVFTKDNDCVALFVSECKNQDYLVEYKMKVRKSNKNTLYSTPVDGQMRCWKLDKSMIKRDKRLDKGLDALKEKVQDDLYLNNHLGIYNIGEDKNVLAWGLWSDATIKKMKLDGVHPTEVIKLKMDKENVYLWYYDNLKSDIKNIDNIKITLK